jgi:hypothetical protein
MALMSLLKFTTTRGFVFDHLSALQHGWFFKIMKFLCGPEFILSAPVTTVGFGVCGFGLYTFCWLPFHHYDTLVTGVFSASHFLTGFGSVTSSTGSLRNVSPLGKV